MKHLLLSESIFKKLNQNEHIENITDILIGIDDSSLFNLIVYPVKSKVSQKTRTFNIMIDATNKFLMSEFTDKDTNLYNSMIESEGPGLYGFYDDKKSIINHILGPKRRFSMQKKFSEKMRPLRRRLDRMGYTPIWENIDGLKYVLQVTYGSKKLRLIDESKKHKPELFEEITNELYGEYIDKDVFLDIKKSDFSKVEKLTKTLKFTTTCRLWKDKNIRISNRLEVEIKYMDDDYYLIKRTNHSLYSYSNSFYKADGIDGLIEILDKVIFANCKRIDPEEDIRKDLTDRVKKANKSTLIHIRDYWNSPMS